jgi:hypothetical protein
LSEPTIAAPQPLAGERAFVEDSTPFEWLGALSEPVRVAAKVEFTSPIFIGDFAVAETVTSDKWFQPLSEPVRRAPQVVEGERTVDPELLTQPEAVHVQWVQPFSTPPKAKARLVEYPSLAFVKDFVPETVTMDKWFRPLVEVPRGHPPVEPGYFAFVEDFEAPSVAGWWVPFNEPPKAAPWAASYYIGLYQGSPDDFVETPPETPTPPFEKVWTDDSSISASWTSQTAVVGDWTEEDSISNSWTEEDPVEC